MSEVAELPRVLVFFDYTCPFCYIDHFRFRDLHRELGFAMTLVPFELRPEMPDEGISAAEYGIGHSERVEAYMMRLAREGGFPFELPDHIPKTRDAIVLGELARDAGETRHWEVHEAIFRAYFGQGRDIGSRAVLLDIAEEHDIDREALANAWEADAYANRLHVFLHLALALGIEATPSALICDELFVGSRPTAVLRRSIERCMHEGEPEWRPEEGAASEGDGASRAERGAPERGEGGPPPGAEGGDASGAESSEREAGDELSGEEARSRRERELRRRT